MKAPGNNVPYVAAIVVLGLFAVAGVLFVSPGPESLQRLGLLFGLLGTSVAAMAAAIKAAEAAHNTNGKLDRRLEAAMHRAMAARRAGDEPATPAEIDETP